MVKTLLLGAAAGLLTALVCGGVLSFVDLPLVGRIGAVVGGAVLVAGSVWFLGTVVAIRRRMSAWWQLRQVKQRRRRDVAHSLPPLSPDEEETLARSERRRLSQRQVAELRAQADEAVAAGDHVGAIDWLDALLEASPGTEAHLARGRLHLDLGNYDLAMRDFLAAEAGDPTSPEPPVAMGDLYFVCKNYEKAIGCFDIALALDPDHAMASCRRGVSHFYRKQYDLALVDLERAKVLDPEIPNLERHLSLARRRVSATEIKRKKRRR